MAIIVGQGGAREFVRAGLDGSVPGVDVRQSWIFEFRA